MNYVEVLDFTDNASSHNAQIRAQLKKSGKMIETTTCSSPPTLAGRA
jgi:predicted nucleic acid-binding protein